MNTFSKQETIVLKVGNIAGLSGLELTVDYNAHYGGYRLEEGLDMGGVSTTKFGDRRRTYGEFVDWLDAVILGLVLKGHK